MAQVINTNVASLNAQRNLTASQSSLATSLERLSSGLRINSAKDDAAGLAISERFTTQIRGLNQAIRNANDGISLSQTAEGALGEISNNLQRIRELAVQSANATNSDSDRAALNQEVQQRLAEVDRVASQTSFNGRKVLDGTFGNAGFQVGANVGETIDLNLETSVRQSQVGNLASTTSTGLNALFDSSSTGVLGDFTASGVATGTVANGTVFSLTLSGGGDTLAIDIGVDDAATLDATALAAGIDAVFTGTTDGETVSGFTINYGGAADLATAIGDGTLSFSRADGSSFTLTESVTGGTFATNDPTFENTENGSITGSVENSQLVLAEGDLAIQNGTDTVVPITGTFASVQDLAEEINSNVSGVTALVTEAGELSLTSTQALTITGLNPNGLATAAVDSTGLNTASVTSVDEANTTIQRVDAALTSISDLRSTFGAIQNRFESTIANLGSTVENLSASRSRILDADFASETANLTRAQILQQAGTAILSQANALPQNVLSLLG